MYMPSEETGKMGSHCLPKPDAGAKATAFMLEMMQSMATTASLDTERGVADDVRWSFYAESLQQHFKAWNGQGLRTDPASKCSHLAHVAALAMVLWTLERDQSGLDDRPATRAENLLIQLRKGP